MGETEIDGQVLHAVEDGYAGVEDDAGEEVEVGVEAVERSDDKGDGKSRSTSPDCEKRN